MKIGCGNYAAIVAEDAYRMSPLRINFSQHENSSVLLLGSDKQIASSLCSSFVLSLARQKVAMHLFNGDRIFTKIDKKISKNKDENNKTKSLKRCIMLILSITLHNIPEGLAVGVAFGGIAYGIEGATLSSALMIALGIGIQNFPEGTAVSVPLRREGLSRKKAFFFGQLSGLVEPISGVLGALLVLKVRTLLPFLLAFAAGAMIYVVVEELIPESQTNKRKELMALFTLIGFSIMMILDVALG